MTYRSRISTWVKSMFKQKVHGPILTIATEDYVDHVTKLADWHLSYLARMVEIEIDTAPPNYKGPLLRALGCRYMDVTRGCLFYPYAPPPEHAAVVRSTLARTLKSHFEDGGYEEDAVSLVDGFLRDGIWRSCLETTEGAFDLAKVLILFADYPSISFARRTAEEMRAIIFPDVYKVLNDWMQPLEPIHSIGSSSQMARLLFGNVWCDLLLDGITRPSEINKLIDSLQPAFLPGLLPERLHAHSELLPELGLV